MSLKQRYLAKPYVEPRALRVTSVLAVLYAIVVGVVTLYTVGSDLLANTLEVSLPVAPVPLHFNPTLKLDGTTAVFAGGPGFDHATLDFSGLPLDARLWLAVGHLIVGGAFVAIALTLAILCRRVGQGDPFSNLVAKALRLTGIIVLAGGLVSQACLQIGQWRVIQAAFGADGASWNTTKSGLTLNSPAWPHPASFSIDFWPIGIGLALFALATVFRYGQKLERDRSELAEEMKGLV